MTEREFMSARLLRNLHRTVASLTAAPTTNHEDQTTAAAIMKRIPWLPAILSSLGAVGLLTALGYVVQNSRDSLLGINLTSSHPTSDYVTLGGQFVLESVASTWVHWRLALIGVATIIVVGVMAAIALHWPRSALLQYTTWIRSFIAVTALYVAKSLWLDLPYIRMADLLEKPPVCETNSGAQRREHDIWERFVCSRDDATLLMNLEKKASIDCSLVPGSLRSTTEKTKVTGTLDTTRTTHPLRRITDRVRLEFHSAHSIEEEYTSDIFLTALIAYLALALCVAPFLDRLTVLTAALLRVLLLCIVLVDAATLPVVYGKVILSTRFPSGRIIYDGVIEDHQALKVGPRNNTCLVVANDEKFVTFYDDDSNKFVQVERRNVHSIEASDTADLVGTRINYYLEHQICGGGSDTANTGELGDASSPNARHR